MEQIVNLSTLERINADLTPAGQLTLQIRQTSGDPTPAKITILCASDCTHLPSSSEFDLDQDSLPPNVMDIAFAGMDGQSTIDLAPGLYKVVVSRGPMWSVWPSLEGFEFEVRAGESLSIDAIIDDVVDRRGWVSGDLHVHGINSPDAPVSLKNRVLSFLSEGVDVLVSTDHDYITDYSPTINSLGAQEEVVNVIGEELTTFDYGHYNGFPLPHQAD
jgi:hypothetical protein